MSWEFLLLMYRIEFQKRGLPHCHLLLILAEGSKLNSPDYVDSLIKAELPNEEEEPQLFEIVKRHMIHGPCGDNNPQCICMDNNECTKKFPKPLVDSTIFSEN